MEKELNDFKIEVLTQLAVINNKLDGYNKIKEVAIQANGRSQRNEKDIEGIKESNKWAFRTSAGAIITSAIGMVFLIIKSAMGI